LSADERGWPQIKERERGKFRNLAAHENERRFRSEGVDKRIETLKPYVDFETTR
jgi:hypothetical protein